MSEYAIGLLTDTVIYGREPNEYCNIQQVYARLLIPLCMIYQKIKIGDTISYGKLNFKLDNILSVYKWNRLIQEETGNNIVFPQCTERWFKFIDTERIYKLYGQLANEIKLYKYVWDNEYNRYLDETRMMYINKGTLLTMDPTDLFLELPLKNKICICISEQKRLIDIVIGSDIYGPITMEYPSLSEFWKINKSTIYKFNIPDSPYLDIVIQTQ